MIRLRSWGAVVGLLLAAGPAGTPQAAADVLHLRSGTSQECIILRESTERVSIRTELGDATIDRGKIAAITREPDDRNAMLQKRWDAAKAAREARRRAAERKGKVERLRRLAMGLVEYEGEWVTLEERTAREEEDLQARVAARELSDEERAAGQYYYYTLWMTPGTYQAIRREEATLNSHRGRILDLYDELDLLNDQIENARALILSDPNLDAAEARAKRVKDLRKQQAAVLKNLDEVVIKGDAVVASVDALLAEARTRLEGILARRNAPRKAIMYLTGPED